MAEVAVDERRLLKTIRWWDGFVIGLANPGFLLIGLWGSILALGGKWAIVLWIISACHRRAPGVHLLRARRHVPGQAGRPVGLRARGLAQALLLRGPDRGLRLLVRLVERARDLREPDRLPADRRVRRRGVLRDDDLDPPIIHAARVAAADRRHVHRALLDLQHPRHAARRRAQLRRRGADDLPDPRDRHRRLRHRRLLEPPDQLELPGRERELLRRLRDVLQPVRDDHGLAVHPRLVDLRAGGRGDVRAGVQGHGQRHPQGAGLGGRAQRRPVDHAPDRRPRDDRLRRPLHRHDRRRLADRRRQLDRRRTASGSSSSSVSARACCSR